MLGGDIIGIVIGMAFIYFILSLVTTSLTELVARAIRLSSSNLRSGLETLLNEKESGLVGRLYDHALIKNTARPSLLARLRGNKGKPTWIPPHNFTLALFDLLVNPGRPTSEFRTLTDLSIIADAIKDSASWLDADTQRQLQILEDTANDITDMRILVEQWFQDMMARVSEWYASKTRIIVVVVALIVTFSLNADSVMLVNRLGTDAAARDALNTLAEGVVADNEAVEDAGAQAGEDEADDEDANGDDVPTFTDDELGDFIDRLTDEFQIIGWSSDPDDMRSIPQETDDIVMKLIGLLFTTIAVSLGAPFWYNIIDNLTRRDRDSDAPDTSDPPLPPPSEERQ